MQLSIDCGMQIPLTVPPHALLKLPQAGLPSSFRLTHDDLPDQRRARRKFRIANFVTSSGSPGIWGPATTNATLLAASEINRRGGILGREIEVVLCEAGGAIEDVARHVKDAIEFDEIDLVMGSHISAVRLALRKAIAGRVPYIYTPVYEGGERTPGVLAIGETPRSHSRPAIHWLATAKQARRWYLIGSDYVWPWLSHRALKNYIAESGGRVIGEEFVPLGVDNHDVHLARIRAAKPDVVVISLIGADSIAFNRSFGEARLGGKILRLAGAMDETVLLGIGADNTENLFCASGYFNCIRSAENEAFLERYRSAFGTCAPPVGSVGESNYEGLHFLETVVRQAGSAGSRALLAAANNTIYSSVRGSVSVRKGRATMPIFLAESDGIDFKIMHQF